MAQRNRRSVPLQPQVQEAHSRFRFWRRTPAAEGAPKSRLRQNVESLGLAVLVALALRNTRFGRHVFAIGSNELSARLCGVPVERVKLLVYALGGAFAGIGAVLQFAYLTGGDPTTASGLELNIIAAVVIGGASLAGGQGTITGTLVGALIMSVVANGCTKLGLSNWVQEIVTGGIIIAAVLLDYLRRRGGPDST
jgi:ribose transport system permease protein